MKTILIGALLGCLAATAGEASAAGRPELFSVSAEAGWLSLSASDSAKAVFDGSKGGAVFGGSLRYSITPSIFVGAGLHVFKKDGERVFVPNATGPVSLVGHPLAVRIRPAFAFLGYRFRPTAALAPYLSAGAGSASYRETSVVGGVTDEQSQSKFCWHAALGADFGRGALGLGVEARYTSVPNAIGLNGVSKVYGEKDLGGVSVLARLSFRR